ncbi:MAG: hypothetical protein HGA31_04865 [Candidatus Moranbacteria bacterium]|nr:hypothetical protein [Candidatus Moranbacteria bacterium]
MPKIREHDYWVHTESPDVVGGIMTGLVPLVFDPERQVDMYVMRPEGPKFIEFPKNEFDSSAQGILWVIRIFERGNGAKSEIWRKTLGRPVSEIGEIVESVVDELRRNEFEWRKWFVEWASRTPWPGWSLPTVEHTGLVLRHGYVSGEKFAVGIRRS